jgi:hypothetical protein
METGREGMANSPYARGLGWIIIPDNVDREQYIQTVFREERVDIYLEDGGMANGAYISRELIQLLVFPQDIKAKGSRVAFITEPVKNILIVVGVISDDDDSQLLEEGMFQRRVESSNGSVTITGKGKTGELFINIDSQLEDGGNVYINLKNSKNKAKFNVNCFGSMNLYCEDKLTLEAAEELEFKITNNDTEKETVLSIKKDVGLTYIDEFENLISIDKEGIIKIIPKTKLQLFEGGEPVVLGTKLKTYADAEVSRIDQIINALTQSATGVQDGGAAYKTGITALLQGIQKGSTDFNSDKTFTD